MCSLRNSLEALGQWQVFIGIGCHQRSVKLCNFVYGKTRQMKVTNGQRTSLSSFVVSDSGFLVPVGTGAVGREKVTRDEGSGGEGWGRPSQCSTSNDR